jgi:NTP pyrophosphatase (non-canonical NTP hydrolase)
MTFQLFKERNQARCESTAQPLHAWLPSQWSNAMAGEVGEACNITKKMDRIWPANQFKQSWNKPEDSRMEELNERLKRELGDVVIYADLLASRQGLTLEECVRTAFNEKSEQIGAKERL